MNPIGSGCVSTMSWKKPSVGMVQIKAARRAHVVVPSLITIVASSCVCHVVPSLGRVCPLPRGVCASRLLAVVYGGDSGGPYQ